jgi:uncharacterized protein (UPF0264 family)
MGNKGLLISVRSIEEAQVVMKSGACWLDLKEPRLGSLGRPSLELVREVLRLPLPVHLGISVAGGELNDWLLLDNAFANALPSHCFLKIALAGCSDSPWQAKTLEISRQLNSPSQLILAYYADSNAAACPNWSDIWRQAHALGCRYVLVDTCHKKLGRLLDFCSLEGLQEMVHSASDLGLGVAIAGSIKLKEIGLLADVGASWIGLRGAVCEGANRTSTLCPNRLNEAVSLCSTFSNMDASNYVLR